MMRLRKIWAEGSFAVLKRDHCISKIRKRGISAAAEEIRYTKGPVDKKKNWAEETLPPPT